jgi:hypothetical protein
MTLSNTVITAKAFKTATGHAPENDDLERCNCPQAGEPGHMHCGWDAAANLPWFMSPNAAARFLGSNRPEGG